MSRPLVEAFVTISQALSSTARPEEAYAQTVAQARRLVSGAASVSLSLRDGAVTRTVVASDATATGLDEAQYASGHGPCLQSIGTGETVLSDDLEAETRWPAFTAAAMAADMRSVLSVPVPDRPPVPDALGSMNHYGRVPGAFDVESAHVAIVLAAHLAALLVVSATASTELEQLEHAVQARDVIGQAKGILMERNGLTAEQAFEVLRVASMNLNRKLREVAGELAFTGELPQGE